MLVRRGGMDVDVVGLAAAGVLLSEGTAGLASSLFVAVSLEVLLGGVDALSDSGCQ